MTNSEHQAQAMLVNFLETNHPDVLFFAIPNGAPLAGGARTSRRLKAEGCLPGVSDLFLAEKRGNYAGAFLEMKTETGRLTDGQTWFLAQAESKGYYTMVCHGFDEARAMVEDYLSWPTAASTEGTMAY